MPSINVGDIVARKSYGKDILFKVVSIEKQNSHITRVVLKGMDIRIIADAMPDDLEVQSQNDIREYQRESIRKSNQCIKCIFREREIEREKRKDKEEKFEESFFEVPPKLLHLDGDKDYLEMCVNTYKQLGLNPLGYTVSEHQQPKEVKKLLLEYRPDILVLTGHDSMVKGAKNYSDLKNYSNSQYYIQAVKEARNYEPSYDDLVIFAGACQSYFEGLLNAGANYASSPERVLIHALDPVFIVEKVAFTGFNQVVNVNEVIKNTITGIKGLGGVQTRGKLREGIPKSHYA